jgi:hypothetical protein
MKRDGLPPPHKHEPSETVAVRLIGCRPPFAIVKRCEMRNFSRTRGISKLGMGRSLVFVSGVMWLAACSDACLFAQSLQLSAPSAAPGEWVAIEIALKSPPGKDILALQWEVEIPTRQLDLANERAMRAVIAVQDAGKSVTCAVPKENPDARTLRCVLAGGQKPIPDGKVTSLSLKLLENAQPGPIKVRLQNAMAVGRDMERVPLEPVETTVTVQPR